MGVPGLTSFLDCNPQLLLDHKLKNCKIIIDGNNLFHFLYYYFNVNYEYGGDYNTYKMFVEFFFNVLHECNIEPFVVFDGGHSCDDKKLKTSLRRAKERIHLCGFLSHGSRGKVLPIMAYETFRNALDRMKVFHITCDYEADEEIAALANFYGCSVLTNDSDFFVYDIKGGTILLDYLNLKLHSDEKTGEKFLTVQLYRLQTLLSQFTNVTVDGMSLFATLNGNDFVSARSFEQFLSIAKFPKSSSSKLVSPRRQTRILGLLTWLDKFENVELAVAMILKNTGQDKRIETEKLIKRSMESYTKLQLHFKIQDNELPMMDKTTLRSYGGSPLPAWFINLLHSGKIPIFMINAVVLHRLILLSQIEVMKNTSAYSASVGIRKIIYGILLSVDEVGQDVETTEETQETCILEYGREQKNLKKIFIRPSSVLRSGRPVPHLPDIPDILLTSRRDMFCEAVGIEKELLGGEDDIPEEFFIFISAAVVWARQSEPKVQYLHLLALLVCAMKLYIIDRLVSDSAEPANTVPHQDDLRTSDIRAIVKEKCSVGDLQKAHQNLEKYTTPVRHSRQVPFNGACLHTLAQFQACFLHVTYLNQLLLLDHRGTAPEHFLNGTLFYSFYKELSERKDPKLFVEEMMVRGSFLSTLLMSATNRIMEQVKDDLLVVQPTRIKRSKRKKGSKTATERPSADLSEPSNSADEDLDNRFSCLMSLGTST